MSDLLFAMAFAKDQQNSHPRCLKYTTTSLSPVKGSFCISPELFKSVKFRIADALISLPLILATHALIANSSPSSAPKFASHSTSSHSPADVFVFPEDAEKNERRPSFLLKTRGDDGEKTTAARANAARAPKAAAAVIVVVVVVVSKR
jgi:hypothetical protein